MIYSPLKAHILSQMGGLLNSLRLYDQAIPYISECIKTDSVRCDTINLIYDLELMGSIHHHASEYKIAEENFKRARILSRQIFHADTLTQSAYLAAIKYELQDRDSALYFIRQSLKRPDFAIDNISLAYASLIYSKIGIVDSALKYAQKLIESPNPANHRIGYRVLLSRELDGYVNRDSIPQYSRRYWDIVESYLNKNGDQAVLIQNSFYNYQVHQRERIKSEMSNAKLRNWLTGTLIVVLLLSLWVVYYRYRNKSHLLRLHAAIDKVAALRLELVKSNGDVIKEVQPVTNEASFDMESAILSKYVQNEMELRVRLRKELLSISKADNKTWTLPDILLYSDAYKQLMIAIKEDSIIKDTDDLWSELDEAVSMAYPEFKDRLTLLAGGRLKPSEYQTALLIKCGVTPTNMATLVGRSKATIAYRRENLGLKLFDKKTELKVVDNIIRLI